MNQKDKLKFDESKQEHKKRRLGRTTCEPEAAPSMEPKQVKAIRARQFGYSQIPVPTGSR
jgi:hypothetical protein